MMERTFGCALFTALLTLFYSFHTICSLCILRRESTALRISPTARWRATHSCSGDKSVARDVSPFKSKIGSRGDGVASRDHICCYATVFSFFHRKRGPLSSSATRCRLLLYANPPQIGQCLHLVCLNCARRIIGLVLVVISCVLASLLRLGLLFFRLLCLTLPQVLIPTQASQGDADSCKLCCTESEAIMDFCQIKLGNIIHASQGMTTHP
jgi:hypothetical protein